MPDFPQNPYPIVGILQGAGAGVTVTGVNLTTGSSEEVETAEDGSYIIDPANMDEGYEDGDIIKINAGTWYTHIKIDIENYPDGIVKDIKRLITINPRIAIKGISLERGILCGKH